jgi:hypothetical protein
LSGHFRVEAHSSSDSPHPCHICTRTGRSGAWRARPALVRLSCVRAC